MIGQVKRYGLAISQPFPVIFVMKDGEKRLESWLDIGVIIKYADKVN